jgi:Bacterial PH domain
MAVTDHIELKPEEKIVREVRRFPLIDGGKYFLAIILMMVPFFFLFPLLKWHWWGVGIGSFLLLSGLIILSRTLFMWYNNVFVITTHRIIDFDQRGFFERVVSQSSFEKIQDVSLHIHGAAQTFFHYGDINIKSAWGSVDLCVPSIFRPARMQRLLLETQEKFYEREKHKN